MSATPAPPIPDAHSAVGVVIGSVAVLLLLAALDQTIVSTALPTIVADLGGLEHLSWVVTAYILASTVSAPLYGKLGDLYGRRVMVFVSVGLFLFGSMLCGLAQTMGFLIFSRAVQGLGGGGLFVLALSIIGDVIPPKERGKVQGVFAGVFSISSIVGPLMGGLFVEHFSWHWIFYINVPIGLAAVAGFALGFKAHPRRVDHAVDYAGAVTLTLALGALVLLTSLGGRTLPWASPQILGLGALMVVAALAFLRIESRAAEPILPPAMFRQNTVWVTSVVGFVAGAVLFGTVTFMPIYLQISRGASPTLSGLQLVPMTFGILAAATLAGRRMAHSARYRWITTLGTGLLALGACLLSTLGLASPDWLAGAYLAITGLGLGCIFPVVTTAVQNAVPRQMMGTATASGLMFRQVGGSIAVAVFGALFAARLGDTLAAAGANLAGEIGPQMLRGLPPELRQTVAEGVVAALHPIFLIAAGIAVAGFAFSWLLEEIPLKTRLHPQPAEG